MNAQDQGLIRQLTSNAPDIRERAWRNIYKNCYAMIRSMVMKHGGTSDEAGDIFRDGLIVLDLNLRNGKFRNESGLNAYIYAICRNLWFKEYNRKQKEVLLQPELILEARQQFDFVIDVKIVTLLMNELKEDCRKILVEYYYNNRSMAELKDMFNVNSIQAAKNKKWRCLNYLSKLFKEKGVTPVWE